MKSSHASTDELTARLHFPLPLSPVAERRTPSGEESFWCSLQFWGYFGQQMLLQVLPLRLVHQGAMALPGHDDGFTAPS